MKITVEWDRLHFFYELNVICQLSEVCHVIKESLEVNQNVIPSLPSKEAIEACKSYLMMLSCDDLKFLGPHAQQMRSKFHIIVDGGDHVHKLLHRTDKRASLVDILISLPRVLNMRNRTVPIITPQLNKDVCVSDIYSYPKVAYGPLDTIAARQFLKTYVQKVKMALTALHCDFGLAHCDIRLENMF